MIYSEDFVWLHFPKCAGTKIEHLFKTYYSNNKRITQDTVDPQANPQITWHDSIADREKRDRNFLLGNRVVVCSFRKLPTWLESRYSFEVHRNPEFNHQPALLLEGKFLEQNGRENHADFYAKKYVPDHLLTSSRLRFVRTEHFESDFKRIFGEFLDVNIIPNWEFNRRINTSQSAVPDTIRNQLLNQQQEVYEKCPYWKKVEDVAYR